jgi:hypothetical protein
VLPWPDNVWMGVSIENRRFVHRADALRAVPAAVRFISAEPLLGPLAGLDLEGIDWLIAGGESGFRHRPVREEWITELRDRCAEEDVAFFFKQWGGRHAKAGGRELQRRTPDAMPVARPPPDTPNTRIPFPDAEARLEMAQRDVRPWGFWTQAKLRILADYLPEFLRVSGGRAGEFVYLRRAAGRRVAPPARTAELLSGGGPAASSSGY